MHLLPQLAEVESHFGHALSVVGIHSAKFPGERNRESLRNAVLRYEVEHPVVNDEEMEIWSSYSVRAWPTLMFLDPQGRVIGKHEGEASADTLIDALEDLVEKYEADGLIDRTPVSAIRMMERPSTVLAFPGKVLADPIGERLFVADSGHNRVVITSLDGDNSLIIGTGAPEFTDGRLEDAGFHDPQGMALEGHQLFVADRRNHAIRCVDLGARTVSTIAGTGKAGSGFADAGPARTIDLRSPWDVAFHSETLYIAMAGMHQLWALDLASGTLRPYAGGGTEGIRDGDFERAWLAQPSGVALMGDNLYFVDSETSSVRLTNLPPRDEVDTIVGLGLFQFGDVDGRTREVRLQHPMGLAAHDGVIYVADSYNHKIKRVYPQERRSETWLGDGTAGDVDGVGTAARFFEPEGVSVAAGKLYIADTNNHRIRVADLTTGEVTTMAIQA